MVTVLDLDLDFFADGIVELPSMDDSYKPALWGEPEFVHFLENRCGLSTGNPVPGVVVESHEQVLPFWREVRRVGIAREDFEVVHVDAHPDLGFDTGPNWVEWTRHLTQEVLSRDPEARDQPDADSPFVNEGNYLLFAAAYRWFSSVQLVSQSGSTSFPIPEDFCPILETGERVIELGKWDPSVFEDSSGFLLIDAPVRRIEPQVPLAVVDGAEFLLSSRPCAASLALSPRYARQTSGLPAVFARYITPLGGSS